MSASTNLTPQMEIQARYSAKCNTVFLYYMERGSVFVHSPAFLLLLLNLHDFLRFFFHQLINILNIFIGKLLQLLSKLLDLIFRNVFL